MLQDNVLNLNTSNIYTNILYSKLDLKDIKKIIIKECETKKNIEILSFMIESQFHRFFIAIKIH